MLTACAVIPVQAVVQNNNGNRIIKIADSYFDKAQKAEDKKTRISYFQKACERYYMQTQLTPKDVYPYIQMGRIYTIEKKSNLAKEYLSIAIGLEPNNANVNYYFGEFYFSNRKYTIALEYYNKAYNNGMNTDAGLNLKLAQTYEKLGDILKSNFYYKKAYMLDKFNEDLADKIRDLESIKYKNTGYYDKNKK